MTMKRTPMNRVATRHLQEKDIPALRVFVDHVERLINERKSIYWMFWRFFRNTSFVAVEERKKVNYKGSNKITRKNISTKGKIVGVLLGFIDQDDPSTACVYKIGIIPTYRRQGLASKLLEIFITTVKKQGCHKIYLDTKPDNAVALQFYRQSGFSRMQKFRKVGKTRVACWKKI